MPTVKIYGASDDLVEVEGDVPGCNEYSVWCKPVYVELSTGDVFKVEYTQKGVWTVEFFVKGRLLSFFGITIVKESHGEGDDPDPYTDTVTITGPVWWVEVWEVYPFTVEEKRTKIGQFANGDELFDEDQRLSDADVDAIWGIVADAKRRAKP